MHADAGPVPWRGGGAAATGTTPTPTSAAGSGGKREGEELTAEEEERILQRSLRRAEQLGYDVKKVLLVEWTV